jgi:branched-chain amino acid transport system substrate-binding protein
MSLNDRRESENMMASKRTWRDLYRVVAAGTVAAGLGLTASAYAAGDPIKIGVISEESAVAGASISKSAQLAADEINAHGGVDGRPIQIIAYDDHSSASDGVRAFQRAATQDKVVAVIGSYISEVALAMEPWSGRLKMPFITPGAASNDI